MKNFLINLIVFLALAAGVAGCCYAAKSSFKKCERYAKGDMQKMHDCLNF